MLTHFLLKVKVYLSEKYPKKTCLIFLLGLPLDTSELQEQLLKTSFIFIFFIFLGHKLQSVFRIRDILIRVRIGTLDYGMDLDPVLFDSGFQDGNKK
jgi:hypothetical protein